MIRKELIPLVIIFAVCMAVAMVFALLCVYVFQNDLPILSGVIFGGFSAVFSTVGYFVLRAVQRGE